MDWYMKTEHGLVCGYPKWFGFVRAGSVSVLNLCFLVVLRAGDSWAIRLGGPFQLEQESFSGRAAVTITSNQLRKSWLYNVVFE